jgi:hypothetical protein
MAGMVGVVGLAPIIPAIPVIPTFGTIPAIPPIPAIPTIPKIPTPGMAGMLPSTGIGGMFARQEWSCTIERSITREYGSVSDSPGLTPLTHTRLRVKGCQEFYQVR